MVEEEYQFFSLVQVVFERTLVIILVGEKKHIFLVMNQEQWPVLMRHSQNNILFQQSSVG